MKTKAHVDTLQSFGLWGKARIGKDEGGTRFRDTRRTRETLGPECSAGEREVRGL